MKFFRQNEKPGLNMQLTSAINFSRTFQVNILEICFRQQFVLVQDFITSQYWSILIDNTWLWWRSKRVRKTRSQMQPRMFVESFQETLKASIKITSYT